MTSHRLAPLALVLLGLSLIAAGCGSSGSSSISKADFVRKGNAICAAGNKDVNAKGKKLFGAQQKQPSPSQMKQFASTVLIPSVQKQVDQLRALGAPKGDKDKVKAILDAAQQGIAKAKQDPLALTKQSGSDPFAKADSLARAYGLRVCGSSS